MKYKLFRVIAERQSVASSLEPSEFYWRSQGAEVYVLVGFWERHDALLACDVVDSGHFWLHFCLWTSFPNLK